MNKPSNSTLFFRTHLELGQWNSPVSPSHLVTCGGKLLRKFYVFIHRLKCLRSLFSSPTITTLGFNFWLWLRFEWTKTSVVSAAAALSSLQRFPDYLAVAAPLLSTSVKCMQFQMEFFTLTSSWLDGRVLEFQMIRHGHTLNFPVENCYSVPNGFPPCVLFVRCENQGTSLTCPENR
jgi:hypothetical protein